MGRLLEIATSLRGQKSLWSPLGKWILEVSKSVDQLFSGGSVAFDYIQVNRSSNQVGVASGTDIIWDTIRIQQNVPYNTGTGVFTLNANRTYRLTVNAAFSTFAGGTAEVDLDWVDATSNTKLVPNTSFIGVPVTDTTNLAPSPVAEALYRPTTNQTVKVRCTSAGGTSVLLAPFSYAIVQQISA